jgi:hypothetical protein
MNSTSAEIYRDSRMPGFDFVVKNSKSITVDQRENVGRGRGGGSSSQPSRARLARPGGPLA